MRGLIFVAVVLDEASQTVETKGSLLKGLLGDLLDDDDDVDDVMRNLRCEEVVQGMRQLLGPISGAVGGQGPSNMPALRPHGRQYARWTLGPKLRNAFIYVLRNAFIYVWNVQT